MFQFIGVVAVLAGIAYAYKKGWITALINKFKKGTAASTVEPSTPVAGQAVVVTAEKVEVSNTDPRSTADIVTECGSLAKEIHDLKAKQATGDGSVGPKLTADSQQLDHDERELAKRHAAGDASAVFKNPYAR